MSKAKFVDYIAWGQRVWPLDLWQALYRQMRVRRIMLGTDPDGQRIFFSAPGGRAHCYPASCEGMRCALADVAQLCEACGGPVGNSVYVDSDFVYCAGCCRW